MNEDALGLHVSDVQTRRADPRDAVGHMNGDQPGHGAHRRVRACAVRCASAWKPWWKLEGLLSSMRSRTMSDVWGWRAGRALSTQGGLHGYACTGMRRPTRMGSAAPGPARGSRVWGARSGLGTSKMRKWQIRRVRAKIQTNTSARRAHDSTHQRSDSGVRCARPVSAERRTRHDRAEHASFNPKSTHQASEK